MHTEGITIAPAAATTAEALWNTMTGYRGKRVEALPVDRVLDLLRHR